MNSRSTDIRKSVRRPGNPLTLAVAIAALLAACGSYGPGEDVKSRYKNYLQDIAPGNRDCVVKIIEKLERSQNTTELSKTLVGGGALSELAALAKADPKNKDFSGVALGRRAEHVFAESVPSECAAQVAQVDAQEKEHQAQLDKSRREREEAHKRFLSMGRGEDFDINRIRQIVNNRTTKEEMVKWFGKPKFQMDNYWTWDFERPDPKNFYRKKLLIRFSRNDVVESHEFREARGNVQGGLKGLETRTSPDAPWRRGG